MEKLLPTIRTIADRIADTERKRKRLAAMLRDLAMAGLIRKVECDALGSRKIVGVDGGIARKSLHGLDCMLVRAAGVCFEYNKGRIGKVSYYPSRMPSPQPDVAEMLSDADLNFHASSIRLKQEIGTAAKCIDAFQPDMVMLDGQVIPHYADRPARSSPIYQDYMGLVGDYMTLFKRALDSGVLLAGVIEDSRNVRFCEIIKKDAVSDDLQIPPELFPLLDRSKDTNLLYWMLEKGERTRVFSHSDSPEAHKILKDFGEFGKMVYSFYIKTAQWDRPIKVDFLGESEGDNEKRAGQVASLILAISGHHSGYGLPAPIIEADSIAKLSETEIDNFYSQILAFAGNMPSIMKLRREQRPF
ncbi:MAG: DNA double-strand break repair nuclease NurA [Candidatus Aenigmarchaeota archaeon]|nr:DNA double-strand break repair nuclease NurA [Candidatus Aenigmarchaeota archaeon]